VLDVAAYERELRPLLGRAAGYARALLGNRHDAEDAVQQTALRAWERIGQYDAGRPFRGWWFAILRNCCLDMLRARRVQRTDSLDGIDPPDTRAQADFPADVARLETALRAVSPAHREILQLRYFGELSYDDLAIALAIPKGTVMSRLHLARKALAAQMRDEGNP
jgi:RNA polymerase sigma-70 factor (ECF subfamily)